MDGADFPYSTGPQDKPISFHMNVQDQIDMYKDNEKHQKAPPILPFELDRINELLGNTFCDLAELRNMLTKAKASEEVSDEAIDTINDKIDKINELILDIPADLSKIAI
tara:strand:- start:346 stop:672 length:327 start_codon:yes stop_codon:yes gene_type:complete